MRRDCQYPIARQLGLIEDNQTEYRPVLPPLRTATFEKAKRLAPGCDVYALEQEWRE